MDRIAEANELFDAVLTGSVDQEKKGVTNVPPSEESPAKVEAQSTAVKTQTGGNSLRKLSLYVGNFPWVSNTHSVLMLITFLLDCSVPFLLFCPHGFVYIKQNREMSCPIP